MSDLVKRLSKGDHAVSATRYQTPDKFKEAVERGFVLVKFTETKGGTELGFSIDNDQSEVDFDGDAKAVKLVGPLTLDYVPVDCSVTIDAQSLTGSGCLIPKKGPAKASRKGSRGASAKAKKRSASKAPKTKARAAQADAD